ncbi:MAG: ornithine cyclodeaminase/alanine dehydrogenase-like protein (mu-crystallin family) [Porticoccaceae bacterium]|jgi:ornithine cyclodeaminase/alanine dehydrogenase-like protein (mu-crystallin family)
MKIRILSQSDVRRTLTMGQAIELMEESFIALTQGTIQVPVRTNITTAAGTMLYKPALMPASKTFALKAVSIFPGNAERGLPVTTGLMLVNDGDTGLPLALMDAEYLTALRTGAATGLATRLLANPETTVAALFGTGGQAACQLQAMLEVLALETIHVFSRNPANAETFCRHQIESAGDCRLVPASSRNVLSECGVMTTATSSKAPVFADDEIRTGVHINGIGSFRPDMSEVPTETVCRATVFVDHREAALREAGDIVGPMTRGRLPADYAPAELGEVLLSKRPGRTSPEETTLFKSVGNAAQDIVCAREILAIAERESLGQVVDF